MENLKANMSISECLKHFDYAEYYRLYDGVVGQADGAIWLICVKSCTVDGHSINKGDMLLFEKGSGKLCGIFTALE